MVVFMKFDDFWYFWWLEYCCCVECEDGCVVEWLIECMVICFEWLVC